MGGIKVLRLRTAIRHTRLITIIMLCYVYFNKLV